MKPIYSLPLVAVLFLASCAPIQPHVITYRLNDTYPAARDKIAAYHRSQQRSFSLIQDQMVPNVEEVSPGQKCSFSLSRRAPDIGTRSLHHSVLSKAGQGAVYEVTEDERPETLTLPALLKLNPPPHVQRLDTWVRSNLSVQRYTETGGTPKK